VVKLRSVTKNFGGSATAVEDVSFHLRKGEFAFLTGASGAGKTTILKLIHMLHRPTSGEVRVSRYSSNRMKRRDLPQLRRRVGYIFQDFRLLENLTAAENVAFALEVTGIVVGRRAAAGGRGTGTGERPPGAPGGRADR
jgi:cell division transport system ATP-binding protein